MWDEILRSWPFRDGFDPLGIVFVLQGEIHRVVEKDLDCAEDVAGDVPLERESLLIRESGGVDDPHLLDEGGFPSLAASQKEDPVFALAGLFLGL